MTYIYAVNIHKSLSFILTIIYFRKLKLCTLNCGTIAMYKT